MLTHVHKVIHLVVGTFGQGLETSPVPYIEETGFHWSDRTLASTRPARPVNDSSELASRFCDRTLALKATECWQGASGQC